MGHLSSNSLWTCSPHTPHCKLRTSCNGHGQSAQSHLHTPVSNARCACCLAACLLEKVDLHHGHSFVTVHSGMTRMPPCFAFMCDTTPRSEVNTSEQCMHSYCCSLSLSVCCEMSMAAMTVSVFCTMGTAPLQAPPP